MKRLLTLISVISACFLGIFLSFQFCEAETAFILNGYDTVYSVNACGDGKFYILSGSGNNFKVTSVDEYSNMYESVLDVETENTAYAYTNGKYWFFRNEYEQTEDDIIKSVSVAEYNCSEDRLSRKVINDAEAWINGTFAVDGSGRYYLKTDHSIEIYSENGKFLRSIGLDSRPCSFTASSDGSVIYCQTEGGLKIIRGDEVLSYNIFTDKIFDDGSGFFSTGDNVVYSFSGGGVTEIYRGFDRSQGNAVIGGCIFGVKSSSLTAIYNEKEIALNGVGGEVFLCAANDLCGCFMKNGSSLEVRFLRVGDVEAAAESEETEPGDSGEPASDVYLFNRNTKTITGIEPETTIAAMKRNIDSGGETLTFFDKNGNIKTSGAIGTGASILFGDDPENRFSLVIYGELSGEGNINTNDKKILADSLLGKQKLEGVYAMAGDVNGDSEVDLRDYVLLDRYLKGQYKIEQKR